MNPAHYSSSSNFSGRSDAGQFQPVEAYREDVSTRKLSVLLLDDNHLTLRYVRLLLGDEFTVLTSSTVEEAAAYVRHHKVDYFISDFHLGYHLTGPIALERLCEIENFNPIECILVTSDSCRETRDTAIAAGFSKIFIKPINSDFKYYFDRIHQKYNQ